MKNKTRKLTISAILVAIGVLLPYFSAHIFGLQGTTFLPMHIPILLAGLVCGALYGGICGVLVPTISCILTNMPAAFPMLPIMVAELAVYGAVSGFLRKNLRWNLYFALITAMVAGRLAYAAVFETLVFATKTNLQAMTMFAALTAGIFGIIIQLIIVPILVKIIERKDGKHLCFAENKAKKLIKNGSASCVVLKNGRIVCSEKRMGIASLLKMYEENVLNGAYVLDKTVGKAAAMLLVLGGAQKVYGEIMSVAGKNFLEENGVKTAYHKIVQTIENRAKNGVCPFEMAVAQTADAQEGYEKIAEMTLSMPAKSS